MLPQELTLVRPAIKGVQIVDCASKAVSSKQKLDRKITRQFKLQYHWMTNSLNPKVFSSLGRFKS